MQRTPGRLIVVGGHSRGVGKTALVQQLLRGIGHRRQAAVKISAHRHAPEGYAGPVIEEALEPSAFTQTGRYLLAGAARAWLCRCPAERMSDAARFVQALQDTGWDVIVESNRIVQHLRPDLTFFVVSDRTDDWKPSSASCLRNADALVLSAGTASVPAAAMRHGWTAGHGRPVFRFGRAWTSAAVARWAQAGFVGPLGPRSDPLSVVVP